MSDLVQLIYRSVASEEVDYRILTDILRVSRKNNRSAGISGLLLADERGFLQVLEGEAAAVNRLYLRVSDDSRHQQVTLIAYGRLEARRFDGWNMRGVGLFSMADTLRAELMRKYKLRSTAAPFDLSEDKALEVLLEVAATIGD